MHTMHPTTEQKLVWGRKVERLMTERGMIQGDLARACGWPRNNICTYINGKSYPAPEKISVLAQVLGVPVERITIPGVERPKVSPPRDEIIERLRSIEVKLTSLLDMTLSHYRGGVFG